MSLKRVPGQLGVQSKTCVRQKGKGEGEITSLGLKFLSFSLLLNFFSFVCICHANHSMCVEVRK